VKKSLSLNPLDYYPFILVQPCSKAFRIFQWKVILVLEKWGFVQKKNKKTQPLSAMESQPPSYPWPRSQEWPPTLQPLPPRPRAPRPWVERSRQRRQSPDPDPDQLGRDPVLGAKSRPRAKPRPSRIPGQRPEPISGQRPGQRPDPDTSHRASLSWQWYAPNLFKFF
jgi:hypothetical protein